ncbi:MAG TPA: restriction endonuclease subunit S [Roseobacter sp.]|uniref:Type I restriction modification DNA specificity domain-containing protein n=1 Tax=marine sediment metagenome TaxID=412755 RepID=A0A0F9N0J8_9ZZZZ|nr:restriction endonuclease subunit S [Roseobacter sp.]
MTELTKHKLSELYTLSSGISSSKDQAGHGQPFLSFSTAFNNYFLPEVLPNLMASNEKEQAAHSIKSGDVFLTRTSEVVDELAISSVAVKDYPLATFSGFLKRLRPKENGKAYPKYIALYLRSQLFRKTMDNNAVMTLRASLNEAIFSYLDIWLPEYDKQVQIGDMLYAIEEKIGTNNKINAELEAMAKLIYGYWFVQFDFPDGNGEPYKSSGGKMVWSDQLKRDIPEGWEPTTLEEFVLVKKGTLITEETANTHGDIKVVSAGIGFSYFHDKANFSENTVTVSASGASAGFINYWHEPIFANDCTVVLSDVSAYGSK